MSELVIVIADLYLGAAAEAPAGARGALAALETLGRFARRTPLEHGWREWVAGWLGLARYAALPAASVAGAAASGPLGPAVWLAEPLHLTEGVGRVHLERRGRLRLSAEECTRLATDFNALFGPSALALAPLPSGAFVLSGPPAEGAQTLEPARVAAGPLAEALAQGPGSAALRRLGAELEMWLYTHPLNAERAGRGVPPVSTLWLWGGGAPCAERAERTLPAQALGIDAYVDGLICLGADTPCAVSPPHWPYAPGRPIERALHVLEVREVLWREPGADLLGALAVLDRQWLAPALAALRSGALERLWLLANDRAWSLRARDLWRRWRRGRAGLEALT